MASLVPEYEDSSDSEPENRPEILLKTHGGEVLRGNLLETVVDDSLSEEEEEKEEETAATDLTSKLPNPLATGSSKLPPAALAFVDKNAGSVFSTSFHRAEEAKTSILQQHVKMTTTELPPEVAGKKICWNFRKGKCRFGSKCKYYHGNEIVTHRPECPGGEESVENSRPPPPTTTKRPVYNQPWPQPNDVAEEDDYLSNAKRKKRAGVADTLVPPKKAMRQLDRLREQERPWTVHK